MKLIRTFILTILCSCLLRGHLFSQIDSNDFQGRTGLLLQLWGPEILGIHINSYLNNRLAINGGFGINLDVDVGLNYYLIDRAKYRSSIYVGVQAALYRDLFGDQRQFGIYLPIGYELVTLKGFTFQFEFGPNIVREDWGQINTHPLIGAIRIGHTFVRS